MKRIEDVWEYDNPTLDTPDLFALGIELSRQSDGIEWKPHRLIGPDPRARALVSTSKTFVPDSQLPSGLPSSTSRGHQPNIPRPAYVGAGWGDHDKFHEWQIHGRALTENMVEDKVWQHEDPPTLRFVREGESAAEGADVIVVSESLTPDDPDQPVPYADRPRPRTLLEHFQARGYGESSQAGGQRGQCRGGGRGQRGRPVPDNPNMW